MFSSVPLNALYIPGVSLSLSDISIEVIYGDQSKTKKMSFRLYLVIMTEELNLKLKYSLNL